MFRSTLMALGLVSASALNAAEFPPAMADFIENDLKGWINAPAIIAAVRAQNSQTAGLSQADIDARDTAWRQQVGQPSQPLIETVLSAPLSDYLRERVTAAGGRITEVFVMDANGLNVAASSVTSDYWQGDEAKFSESYGRGAGAVFIDDVELDESTQRYQGQVSFSLSDPASGVPIGAVTVGLDASAFY
ncbi:MAG: cache domain-containing protein [Sulfitobacter sp.]|nr:cache domain-containing protein [Sulfitobacter sp.]